MADRFFTLRHSRSFNCHTRDHAKWIQDLICIFDTKCATWHDARFRFEELSMAFCGFVGSFIIPLAILLASSATNGTRTFTPRTKITNLTIIARYDGGVFQYEKKFIF